MPNGASYCTPKAVVVRLAVLERDKYAGCKATLSKQRLLRATA